MKRFLTILLAAVALFTVSACSKEKSAEDILNEMEKEHGKLKVVELEGTDKETDKSFVMRFDYEHNKYLLLSKDDPDTAQYLEDDMLYVADKGKVADSEGYSKISKELMKNNSDCLRNLIVCFKRSDNDFYKDFHVKEKGDTYVLTYQGGEEKQKKLLQMMIDRSLKALEKASEVPAEKKVSKVSSLNLVATVDKATHRLIKVNYHPNYEVEGSNGKKKTNGELLYNYVAYNKNVKKIEKPEIFK